MRSTSSDDALTGAVALFTALLCGWIDSGRNAIKFTPSGTVTIGAETRERWHACG